MTANKYLPRQRGFNSFFGILNGISDYNTYRVGLRCNSGNPFTPDSLPPTFGTNCAFHAGKDLLDNDGPADLSILNSGRYITELFGERAVAEIEDHDVQKPLFLYFAPTAPHTPLQAPSSYTDRCADVITPPGVAIPDGRKIICGMMAAVDDQIGNIVSALDTKGMLDSTLFVYLSDNGGVTKYGSNNGNFRSFLSLHRSIS